MARIALGLQDCLYLGNLSALRDWGHARDYVQMQWLMLQQEEAEDFVIATGEQYSVREFVQRAAAELGITLEFRGAGVDEIGVVTAVAKTRGELRARCKPGDVIVRVDPRYFRPTEVETLLGDPAKAKAKLGWEPTIGFAETGAARWSRATTPAPSATAWSSWRASRPTTTTSERLHGRDAPHLRRRPPRPGGQRHRAPPAGRRLHEPAARARHAELDLTDERATRAFFEAERPEYVFLAAAKVGGIVANNTYPAEFIRDNLAIQTNVIHAAHLAGVQRLLFLGISCIYPRLAPQPMKESCLLTGPLEPTNRPYALAKIAGIEMCWSYNRQYGTKYLAAMPTNLYGPGDNYHPTNSHVIPALLRKFHEAKHRGDATRHRLGHRHAAARVPVQRRHGRRLRLPDEPARRPLRPRCSAATRASAAASSRRW